jgi:transposase
MGKPYSEDLRERVEARIAAGHSRRDASRHFGVSASFAVKLARRVAVTGSVAPGRQGRPPGNGKLAEHMPQLVAWVEAQPDISMPELAAKLEAATGVGPIRPPCRGPC